MKIKRDDRVRVISGNDKGKEGIVLKVSKDKSRVIVEGVRVVKRHQKPTQQMQTGGIIEKEAFIHVSNVMLVCPNCKKPSKVAINKENSNTQRVCKSCNKPV